MKFSLLEALLILFFANALLEVLIGLLFKVRGFLNIALIVIINALMTPPVILTHNINGLAGGFFAFASLVLIGVLIFVLEGSFYKYCVKAIEKPFLFSFTANLLSYPLGLFILKLILA